MILRRYEISRLEAFSDAVFAFALALLVVSVDAPSSYPELVDRMLGGVSFACCFALLMWIWYEHNAFFRRLGLQDGFLMGPAQLYLRQHIRQTPAPPCRRTRSGCIRASHGDKLIRPHGDRHA